MDKTLREHLVEATGGRAEDGKDYESELSGQVGAILDSTDLSNVSEKLNISILESAGLKRTNHSVDYFVLYPGRDATPEHIQGLVEGYYKDKGFEIEHLGFGTAFRNGNDSVRIVLTPFPEDFYLISETRETVIRADEDMTGYETLDDYLGENITPRIKPRAKEIFDLAESTRGEPENVKTYLSLFAKAFEAIRAIYNPRTGPRGQLTFYVEGTDTTNRLKVKDFMERAYPIIVRACDFLSSGGCSSEAIKGAEKLVGAYILGCGGNLEVFDQMNEMSLMQLRLLMQQNPSQHH